MAQRWLFIALVLVVTSLLIYLLSDNLLTNVHNYSPMDNSPTSGKRYLTSTIDPGWCGGMGNMLWRLLSLYAIGKQLGRVPYFSGHGLCMAEFKREAEEIFPKLAEHIHPFDPKPPNEAVVETPRKCCAYIDYVQMLRDEKAQYVRVTGDYFQHPKFIAGYEEDLKRMLEFAPALQMKMDNYRQELFGNDTTSHKFCIHTRRGDFILLGWASNLTFLEAAIDFTATVLQTTKFGRRNVSLVLFGEDKLFLADVEKAARQTYFAGRIYTPDGLSTRGEDMCFAASYCDSLLMSAQTSTFAWWIAYIVGEIRGKGPIFFNANYGEKHRDSFMPAWIPLKLAEPVPSSRKSKAGNRKKWKVAIGE